MSFSKIIVVGNLGKDPELRYMPDGRPVASFSICANERRKNGSGDATETQNWFTANVYGNSAEAVSQHLQKGDQVYIEGRLKPELWKGRDGETRLTMNINTSDVQFLGKRRREGAAPGTADEAQAAGGQLSDEDVPF